MYKVKCADCREIGFTAAPKFVKCSCGGRLKVIPFSKTDLGDNSKNRIAPFISGTSVMFQRAITTTPRSR